MHFPRLCRISVFPQIWVNKLIAQPMLVSQKSFVWPKCRPNTPPNQCYMALLWEHSEHGFWPYEVWKVALLQQNAHVHNLLSIYRVTARNGPVLWYGAKGTISCRHPGIHLANHERVVCLQQPSPKPSSSEMKLSIALMALLVVAAVLAARK